MATPNINATEPKTVPASTEMVYDKWFLTQLIIKANATSAQTIVQLTRSAETDAGVVLMPPGKDAVVSFNLDVFKEMANTPEVATAMDAILTAVVAYAHKKNLL